jgi:hypothetical protein
MIACYIYIFSWDCNKTQLILLCIVVAESFILPLKVDSHSAGQQNGVFTKSVFVSLSRQPSSGPQAANSLSAKSVCQLTLALYHQRATAGAALCNAEHAKQAVVSSGIQSNIWEIWIPCLCSVLATDNTTDVAGDSEVSFEGRIILGKNFYLQIK